MRGDEEGDGAFLELTLCPLCLAVVVLTLHESRFLRPEPTETPGSWERPADGAVGSAWRRYGMACAGRWAGLCHMDVGVCGGGRVHTCRPVCASRCTARPLPEGRGQKCSKAQ